MNSDDLAAGKATGQIVGTSSAIALVRETIAKYARSESHVLITGENGSGKELVANAIHAQSKRHDKPLVVVNSGGLPEELANSTLFGHQRGAFTGAVSDRIGKFARAHLGTIFLDEIGDFSLRLQVALLRTLQFGEVEILGGPTTKVDVRVIAATNHDLGMLIVRGEFRTDLFYRLNVLRINVPPLRDRQQDVPLLAYHFLRRSATREAKNIASIDDLAMEKLLRHKWPGNIRELESVITRAVITADSGSIRECDIDFASDRGAGRPTKATLSEVRHLIETNPGLTAKEVGQKTGYSAGYIHHLCRRWGIGLRDRRKLLST